MALDILFIPNNTETIRVAYRSEYNHNRKKKVILLMIADGKKWHYLAITNLSALLAKKSSNHDEDFYCLNCFNSYTTKNKLKEHEKYVIITIIVVQKCQNVLKNIEIQSWRKIIKSTICNLS